MMFHCFSNPFVAGGDASAESMPLFSWWPIADAPSGMSSKKPSPPGGAGNLCKPVEVRAVGGAWRRFASRSEAAAAFEGLDAMAIGSLVQGKPTHVAGQFEARNPGEAARPSKQPAVSLKSRELLFCRKGCGRSFDWPAGRGNHEKACKPADPAGGVAMLARAAALPPTRGPSAREKKRPRRMAIVTCATMPPIGISRKNGEWRSTLDT